MSGGKCRMAQDNAATNVINGVSTGSAGPTPPTSPAAQTGSSQPTAGTGPGRGVLDGAFAILEALARTDDGLGLTALAHTSGLAKASAYRLAEQLVELDAVHREDCRYYIGPRIGRLGQRWQPDPLLRQAAQAPVHHLAVQSGATASLRILHEDKLRLICATTRHGQTCLPMPADPQSTARTATGRVLYAAQPADSVALPDCWTARQWRQLRDSIRDPHATVVDHQDAFPGICCVAAPVWSPNRTCVGAVTVLVQAATPAANLPDLVVHAARRIGDRLR
jgi:IclR family transcriptional regulator, acetate operon repressor